MADIEAHPTLDAVWVPKDDDFTVDGITVPSQEQLGKGKPVVAFDASITEPYDGERVRQEVQNLVQLLQNEAAGAISRAKDCFRGAVPLHVHGARAAENCQARPWRGPTLGAGPWVKDENLLQQTWRCPRPNLVG